ncbi:MAG: hypothetical protein ACTSSA_12710 [Candidatus Freyarchaeota archaeon]
MPGDYGYAPAQRVLVKAAADSCADSARSVHHERRGLGHLGSGGCSSQCVLSGLLPAIDKVKSLEAKRAPAWMLVAIVALAAACIIFGLYPWPIYNLANSAAEALYYLPAYFGGII